MPNSLITGQKYLVFEITEFFKRNVVRPIDYTHINKTMTALIFSEEKREVNKVRGEIISLKCHLSKTCVYGAFQNK